MLKNQALRLRAGLSNEGHRFNAVELRHRDIQDCDFRLELLAQTNSFTPVRCLRYDNHPRLRLQNKPQALRTMP